MSPMLKGYVVQMIKANELDPNQYGKDWDEFLEDWFKEEWDALREGDPLFDEHGDILEEPDNEETNDDQR